MDTYFKQKAAGFMPKYSFNGSDFNSWKSFLIEKLKSALGPMPNPIGLNPEIVSEIEEDGLIKRRIIIDLEENMSAPIWLYIPKNALKKPAPAILCCHGHGQFERSKSRIFPHILQLL